MKNQITRYTIFLFIGILLFSCNDDNISIESDFPKEFYLLNDDCFGRFFYENTISGELEFEVYCKDKPTLSMTESVDSITLKDEFSSLVLSKNDFFDGYGKPIKVSQVPRNKIQFSIDTLKNNDSLAVAEDAMHRIKLQIKKDNVVLYDKVYKCNRLVMFDSSNISLYSPITHPNVFFIDGVNPCLVMEMGYYDETGEFAGWERFSADIKSFFNEK